MSGDPFSYAIYPGNVYYPYQVPPQPISPYGHGVSLPSVFYPPGCICPPTSEKTCGNPACPRRSPTETAAR